MKNLNEYIEILKTLPGLNVENFIREDNIAKCMPSLLLIENTEELNNGIEHAQNYGIELVSEIGTLNRITLLNCVERSLSDAFEQNISQGRAV